MDKKTFEARIRQIHALDMNAFDIYSDLAELFPDDEYKKQFKTIARDEKKHIALTQSILAQLKK